MGYTKDVIKGVSWIGLLSFLTKFVGFIEAIILARILVPAQFGAYGIALLALGLLEVVTETGVNIVLIQEQEIDKHVSSAWLVSIIRGIIISAILFIISPYISVFFHSPESLVLLYFISVVPLLRGFINPAAVKLQKELQFNKRFWYQFTILFLDTTTSIIITYITKNPIGIAMGLLVGVATEMILSYAVISPRPNFHINKDYFIEIFHRGKWITASSIFEYLFYNADNIAVGRLLGAFSLGLYQMAYSLSVIPLTELSNVFIYVTFPIYAKISEDKDRLSKSYIKTIGTVFILSIPFVFILIFFPQIIVFLLGKKWSAIVTIMPVLAILGFVKAISGPSTGLFLSKRKQNYTTVITLVSIVGLLLTIVPLVNKYGILGAALAALIGSILAVPIIVYFVFRIFTK